MSNRAPGTVCLLCNRIIKQHPGNKGIWLAVADSVCTPYGKPHEGRLVGYVHKSCYPEGDHDATS